MPSRPSTPNVSAHSASAPPKRATNALTFNADKSPVPLYHRLFVLMRERIVSGTYRAGDVLPSEVELAQTFGVSRITVKRALNDLAAEGLVDRSRGRGTTVTQASASRLVGSPITASIDGLLANLSVVGQGTSVEVIEFEYLPASTHVAQQLELPVGTTVQHAVRIRYLKGRPYSHSTSYVTQAVGRAYSREDMDKMPLIDLLKRSGVQVARVEQTITSTLADHDTARFLDVCVGSPLLKLRRVFFDDAQRAINYAEILYAPDRFEYRMTWSMGPDDTLEIDARTYRARA